MEFITESRQEAAEFLRSELGDEYLALLDEVMPTVVDGFEIAVARVPGERQLRVRTWVVRTQDLDMVKATLDAVKAAGASSFFSHGALVPSLVGTVTVLLQTARTVWAKGAALQSEDLRLIAELAAAGPSTESEIAAWREAGSARPSRKAVNQIAQQLESLTRVRVRDGSVVPMVAKDGDGRWAPLV